MAERDGRIVGYVSGLGLIGHAVAETTDDLKALIAAAPSISGPGFFVPIRNGELFSWLLRNGMQGIWPAIVDDAWLVSGARRGVLAGDLTVTCDAAAQVA